jgi:hypothetical protein
MYIICVLNDLCFAYKWWDLALMLPCKWGLRLPTCSIVLHWLITYSWSWPRSCGRGFIYRSKQMLDHYWIIASTCRNPTWWLVESVLSFHCLGARLAYRYPFLQDGISLQYGAYISISLICNVRGLNIFYATKCRQYY